jgi:hypothetical protein
VTRDIGCCATTPPIMKTDDTCRMTQKETTSLFSQFLFLMKNKSVDKIQVFVFMEQKYLWHFILEEIDQLSDVDF